MANSVPSSRPRREKQTLAVLILGSEMYFNRIVFLCNRIHSILHATKHYCEKGCIGFIRLPKGSMAQKYLSPQSKARKRLVNLLLCSLPSFVQLVTVL